VGAGPDAGLTRTGVRARRGYHDRLMAPTPDLASATRIGRGPSFLVAAATALVLVALSIVPFLAPAWVRFEQDRSGVAALTGFGGGQLDTIDGQLLGALALWQGDFHVLVDGAPVLNDREVQHLLDVRAVMWGGFALAAALAAVAAVVFARARSATRRASAWRAVAGGARATTIGVLAIGAFAVLAFPVFFETFHRLFFSEGTYLFDPRTERLVQLFPTQFWSDTTIAIGSLVLVLSVVVGLVGTRRARGVAARGSDVRPGWSSGRTGPAGTGSAAESSR
jgi:integral membrane protein (TIGR01906 family)